MSPLLRRQLYGPKVAVTVKCCRSTAVLLHVQSCLLAQTPAEPIRSVFGNESGQLIGWAKSSWSFALSTKITWIIRQTNLPILWLVTYNNAILDFKKRQNSIRKCMRSTSCHPTIRPRHDDICVYITCPESHLYTLHTPANLFPATPGLLR